MLKLSDIMKQALRRREPGGGSVFRMPVWLYEIYQPDYFPPEGGMFDPADAVERFSEVSMVWLGHVYRRLVTSRGSINKSLSGQFNGCSVTFTNVGPDNSKPMSEFVLANEISGLRLVIRYIDMDWSGVLADSVIVYVGRLRDPETTSDEECSIPSKEELGSILHEIPRREFRPDDPLGRSPTDPLFEGIRSSTRSGVSHYTEQVTKRVWGFLWRRTKEEMRTNQFSAENDGHLGDVMPWINGRCQMEGIPVAWEDEGVIIRGLYVFAGSKVDAIENIQCQTEGFTFQQPPSGPPFTVIALGDPGGTLSNATYDVNFAELGYLSNTAYVVAHIMGSKVDTVDPAPTISALVFGYADLPDTAGHFTLKGRTDNPALIARRVLADPQALGMNPGLIGDASFVRTALLCDQYIKDETNSEVLGAGPELVTAIETGDVTRFRTGSAIDARWWKFQMDPLDDDPRGIPIDDPYPVYPGQPPAVAPIKVMFRRRFTFNAPLTDKMKAVDFLHTVLFPASRLFHKTGQDGRINIDMERPADATYLVANTVVGQSFVLVGDVEPWRQSLEAEILVGAGLITSEVKKVTAAAYDPASGNAVTIAVSGAGSTTLALESGGPTLIGGTTSVAAGATILVGGISSPGYVVSVTIDGRKIELDIDPLDDIQTIAASVAMIINADKEAKRYVLALWDGDVRVRVTSKLGKLTLNTPLAETHSFQLDSPTVAPTATVLAGGALAEGEWDLAYSYQSALGETMISPRRQVTTTATNKRIQTGAFVMPVGAASVNWYLSVGPGDPSLRFVGNAPSGSSFSISAMPVSSSRKEPQFNDTGEEVIRILFNWGPENVREGSKVEWPLAAKDDAINQVYIEYISAIDGFATKQLTVNDYEHQARTGNVNRDEINGRGIDSYDQAVRIANARLAFKRDGNFSVRWIVDEAGLPYEEGDVGCISDSSGLVNQPVRIENIDIQNNGDVGFEARIYSTHMMQDLTGQKEIAISSPLKYIGGPPPPATNVVLEELPPVASGASWVSRVHGTFDFGVYTGRQVGHIYVKLAGETEYKSVDVVAPSLENTGTFDLNGLPRTTAGNPHWLKIVTESAYGKSLGLEAATAYPIDLLPPSATLLKLFDNVIPRDSFTDILGLTVGVARSSVPGTSWFGCDLYRDRGYGPERVGTLRTQSTMGRAVKNGFSWLGDDSGYNILWIQLWSGTLSDATDLQISSGKNNYFVGREKLGVRDWTDMGGGLWKGEGLVRGLNHTEIFKASHMADEDFLMLDENVFFLPCIELRDVDKPLTFTAQTIMQQFADASFVPLIVRGDSIRPYAVTDYEAFRDASQDWLIHFQGWPTPSQIPAEWAVEIYDSSAFTPVTGLKRVLPVVIGTSNACSLRGTADGEGGVIKNSLYCGTGGEEFAVTVQALTKTWTRYDFNIRWIGPDHSLFMPITFDQFTNTAHLGAVNRPATPIEKSSWAAVLGPVAGDHAALWAAARAQLEALFHGTEYLGLATSDDTYVNDLYQAFLGRNSEPAGHAYWLNDVTASGREHTLDAFGESIEFEHEIIDVLEPGADPSRWVSVHLEHKDNTTPGEPDIDECPISLSWEATVFPGTVAERVLNFHDPIFEEAAFSDLRNQVDPGYAQSKASRAVSGRVGPRYTVFLAGTEYRVYADYVPNAGQKPLARTSAPAGVFPFPLRLVLWVKDTQTGALCVENVTTAGDLLPATVYSDDQQIMDFGSPQGTIHVKIYQRGKYFNIQGFPIQFSTTG